MSYDLMVFEKSKIPANRSEFFNWYEQKMECEKVQDISCASEKLQNFFHSVRQIFPPVNGPFAPEHPETDEYLCDYSIYEDMIYLSFSYSAAKLAYSTIKRAAYFAGVGFFNPGDNASSPLLFDSRCPMLLEGEGFRPVEVDHFDSISENLSRMTVKNRSYLYVTDQIESYIQIGGYGDAFTVEKRIYTGPTEYTHSKAGFSHREDADADGEVIIAGNRVKVKRNQVLPLATAEQLFLDFFQGTETAEGIEWTEMEM